MVRALDKWLVPYLRTPHRPHTDLTHVIFCVCDHFEPFHHADPGEHLHRMQRWEEDFPTVTQGITDSCGTTPAHTFFSPIEQYDEDILASLQRICRKHHTEVEVHLHHAGDTADTLTAALEQGKRDFSRHGFLCKDPTGETRYAFIHGNWALDHSHPTRDRCGVDSEIAILRQTGCYADFTFPSAPDPTQPPMVNLIYYATEDGKPCSHHQGTRAQVGSTMREQNHALLLVNGPLALNWQSRKFGLIPRIENSEISGANPPTAARFRIWNKLGIHIQNRPDWVFIKLHTHGGTPQNMKTLLGQPMRDFYEYAMSEFTAKNGLAFHFATAREMANMVHAAEDGQTGSPHEYRDYFFSPP